jgi:hypothetical protein
MEEFGQVMLLAREFVPAMLGGGQCFDEIEQAHGFQITDVAGKFNVASPFVSRPSVARLSSSLSFPVKEGMV